MFSRRVAGILFQVTIAAQNLAAQSNASAIVGACVEASGASVPNAAVEAREVDTNLRFEARTNVDGYYVLTTLPVGAYTVTVSASGFKSSVHSGLVLRVGDRARVDFVLEIGVVEQKVEVQGEAPLVQADSSGLGEVIENRRITDMPLNSRNALSLTLLTPGVRNLDGGTNLGFGRYQNYQLANIGVNGSPGTFNSFLLDGGANNAPGYNEVAVAPLVESIQEFKVLTNFMPPEYGLTGGGVITTVTKSGTNLFHGSLYEFLRNDKLDARNTFVAVRPPFRFNQYGASMGGPIWIPKVYNGKNHTFFFFNYEASRNRKSANPITTVPTPGQRGGDFSDLFDSTGKLIPIFDPATTVSNPNGPGFIRSVFPGNIVPVTRLDPVARNVTSLIPQPNRAPNNPFTQALNYIGVQPVTIDVDQYHGRIDHSFSASNRLFGRWSYNEEIANNQGSPWPEPIWYSRIDTIQNHQALLSDVHTFSPSLLNEFRASATRQYFPFQQFSFDQGWPQKIGLPANVPPTLYPLFNVGGLSALGGSGTTGLRSSYSVQVFDMVTKISGNHTLKFGADVRKLSYANFQVSAPSGSFNFPASLTGNPQATSGTGSGFATFLLGQVGSGALQVNAFPTFIGHSYAFFAGDDWKVTRRLTLNLGLRYDFQSPPVERRGLSSNFDPSGPNPVNANLMGKMEFARHDYGDAVWSPNRKNIGPRIGFAYDLGGQGKTVLRGGYGILYTQTFGQAFISSSNGFSTTSNYLPPGNNANFAAFQLQNGPPFIDQPLGAALGPGAFLGSAVTLEETHRGTPYVQQWNFGVQRELPGGWMVEAAYAGNRGIHLYSSGYQYDDLDPRYLSLGLSLQNQAPNPLAGQIPGALGAATVALRQTLLPFPQYSSVSVLNPLGGASTYHSFQARALHRFGGGLTLLASYTNAKLIADNEASPLAFVSSIGSNPAYQAGKFNRRVERALDPTDISQALVISSTFELPFGRGKPMRIENRFLNAAFGNWDLSGIFTIQSGLPLVIRGASNFLADRPNSAGVSAKASNPTRYEWFDTAAFTNPPIYTYGNVGRTLPDVRGPGLKNIDLALLKNFPVREQLAIQFRAEAFNLANLTNLGMPNTTFVPGSQGANVGSAFGTITTAYDARSLQFGIKLLW